tara:strand:+ start:4005 stop:4943 length:939 start_codon:yes stop_codon:yes gene_type:complete
MSFQNVHIAQLLNEISDTPRKSFDDELVGSVLPDPVERHETGATCDVAYLMFLEPSVDPDPNMGPLDACINTAIRVFQPNPIIAHCELLIPPVPEHEGLRSQFATYIGRTSGWQSDKSEGLQYYLITNLGRWRAVPIFSKDIAAKLRYECDQEIGVPYSISRYITSARPMRFFASLLPDRRRSPAHCATLAARVLRKAVPGSLKRCSAWYAPSTLFLEASEHTKGVAKQMGATATQMLPQHTVAAIDRLLRGQMTRDNVVDLGDDACLDATRSLTLRVCADLINGDLAAQRISQKQLASALLKWTLLREEKV